MRARMHAHTLAHTHTHKHTHMHAHTHIHIDDRSTSTHPQTSATTHLFRCGPRLALLNIGLALFPASWVLICTTSCLQEAECIAASTINCARTHTHTHTHTHMCTRTHSKNTATQPSSCQIVPKTIRQAAQEMLALPNYIAHPFSCPLPTHILVTHLITSSSFSLFAWRG